MNEKQIMYKQFFLQVHISLAIYRNSHLQVLHKKDAHKFFQNLQENTCARVSTVTLKFLNRYSPNNLHVSSTKNCNLFIYLFI